MEMNRTPDRSLTEVIGHDYGSCIHVSADGDMTTGSIVVMQKRYELHPEGLCIETRCAELVDSVERMVMLGMKPGDKLGGNIVIQQFLEPIIPDYPELYMLTRENGAPVLVNGKCVWNQSFYSESLDDQDRIIIDVFESRSPQI